MRQAMVRPLSRASVRCAGEQEGSDEGSGVEQYSGVTSLGRTVYFFAPVTAKSELLLESSLYSASEFCKPDSKDHIDLVINSQGGEMLGIYDLIHDYPIPIHTWVRGCCASAATLIFLAGKKRYISPTSFFVAHSSRVFIYEDLTVTEGVAKELYEKLVKHNSNILKDIYRENTRIPDKILDALDLHEFWLTPKECVKYGIAEKVKTFEVDVFQTA